jgi:hypothetical protein
MRTLPHSQHNMIVGSKYQIEKLCNDFNNGIFTFSVNYMLGVYSHLKR